MSSIVTQNNSGNNSYLISFDSPRLGYGKVILDNPHFLGIPEGVTVVLGKNGSGKTTLATILEKGRYAYGNRLRFKNDNMKVKMLSFSDIHSLSGMEVQYMAQRMESTMNDYVPTVADIMGEKIKFKDWNSLCRSLSLHDIEDKKINYLSSGELRKLLIINALLENPDVIILDNPYIGLDANSRKEFDDTMRNLKADGKNVILVLCDSSDIPSYSDSVLLLDKCKIEELVTEKDKIFRLSRDFSEEPAREVLLPPRPAHKDMDYETAFSIKNGHLRYADREILRNLDWTVKHGECWVLTGENGSGKSLLLSLVCADNPQGYANDITLFDRKRGSGESIWEIKDAIGYVSPEMQLFFKSNSPVKEIVIQGLRTSLQRYRPTTSEEEREADEWLSMLGIKHLEDKFFNQLSAGEQRLVLVARAMIKQPELLVLDEPLHGLDSMNKKTVIKIVNELMKRNRTSLIYVTHYLTEIPACVSLTKKLQKI
ncbi:MAG: ATP-binding cassette domain-containing protein [Muribaculaceae bacterium]|nr:ATP-binding cassette domain-containing protein [Muribaculaceae bacterium]